MGLFAGMFRRFLHAARVSQVSLGSHIPRVCPASPTGGAISSLPYRHSDGRVGPPPAIGSSVSAG